MKLKNILIYLVLVVLITTQLNAQANTNPEVTNVAFSITGTTVTVTYNVTDAVQTSVTIIMLVSSNNGSTWDYDYGTATGDIGTNVSVGSNKTIQWTYTGDYNPDFKIRIYANDKTADGSPCPGLATVDYGGKTYHTIQIGTQCWLKENLDVGLMIQDSQDPSDDVNIEKYCYDNNINNCITYGGLYAWHEAMQYTTTEGTKGICPNGWHIPKLAEFQLLSSAVVGDPGAIMQNGSNTSGFSAIYAGQWRKGENPKFILIEWGAHFFSSTLGEQYARIWILFLARVSPNDIYITDKTQYWFDAVSVRCLKD